MNGQVDLFPSIAGLRTEIHYKNKYESCVLKKEAYLSEEEKYETLSMGNEIRCLTEGCKGNLKNKGVFHNIQKNNKFLYKEDSIVCRCEESCKKEFVFVKNNLSSRVVSFKL